MEFGPLEVRTENLQGQEVGCKVSDMVVNMHEDEGEQVPQTSSQAVDRQQIPRRGSQEAKPQISRYPLSGCDVNPQDMALY